MYRSASNGRDTGDVLDRSQLHHRATQDRQQCTHTHTIRAMYIEQLTAMFLEEAGELRENKCMHVEDMQTSHRNTPIKDLNIGPSCSEATLLPAVPLCNL